MSTKTTEFAAQITGDANGALAALEKVKVRVQETARAAESANTKVAGSADLLVRQSEKAAKGVAAITQALYAMEAEGSSRVLALGAAVGNFADLLGPGGKVVSGVAIVSSAIVALFLQAKEKSAEATRAIEEDLTRLVNAGDFVAITKKLQELERGTAGTGFTDGRAAIRERIALLTNEAFAVGKSARFYRERQEQIIVEKKELARLTDEYDRYFKALTSQRNGPSAPRGLAGQPITTTADSDERLAATAKKTREELDKLEKAANDAYDAIKKGALASNAQATKSLEQYNEELGKRLTLTAEQRDAEAEASANRAKTLSDLQAEFRAVMQGAKAYDEYQDAKGRNEAADAAVRDAQQRALKEGKQLSNEQVRDLRFAAQFAYDFQQSITAAVDALRTTGAGALATQLGAVAQSATQIATSLGDAGKNLARLAAIAGPLFTGLGGLQDALGKRDTKGNIVKGESVGIFSALRGRNGADSQAKAIAGSLAIVGAVAGIADALDVFGTQAKQKAAEMKEAARAFAIALQDFAAAANPTSGATEQIRQARLRAEELARQAIAAGGGTGGSFEGGVTSASLRAQAERLRAVAIQFEKTDAKIAKNLRSIASGFDDVADSLVEVEAAARRQVLANIEDLGVRRLLASGQTEAAELLRAEIAIRRELETASKDVTTEGIEYYNALKAITAAETAAAAASRARAAILQRIDDDNAFLGGTDAQRIQRSIEGLVESFPDLFAGAFDGIDLSTSDGLARAKEIIKGFYLQLAEGGITEAERPIVDFLKRLFGDIDSAIGNLPGVLEPLAQQLEAFSERVQIFGLTLTEQLQGLGKLFKGKFGETFDEILSGADLGTADGRAAFKSRLQGQLAEILADGVITDAERPYYNALLQFLGLVNEALDDAAADAEEAAATAAGARSDRRTGSGTRVSLFDLEGVDAVRENLRGFGTAFAGLFAQFDLSTLAGVEGAKEVLRGIFQELEGLSDEEILARFGLTRDELVTALLDTDSGFDSLRSTLLATADAALAAAQASREFSDSIGDEYLRSTGRGQEADSAAAKRKRDERIAKAQELGLGQSVLDQIEEIYQGDLRAIAARYAEEAGAAAPAAASSTGSRGTSRARARNTTVVGDFGGLSEVTGQSLAGLLREVAINTGERGAIVSALLNKLSAGVAPLSSLSFPSYPTATSGGGGVTIGAIHVTIGSLNAGGLSPNEAGTLTARAISRELGRMAVAESRYLGSAKRS